MCGKSRWIASGPGLATRGVDFCETCFVAHVTPVIPGANIKVANASAPAVDGVDALFAALLNDAPQMPGSAAPNNFLPLQPAASSSQTGATPVMDAAADTKTQNPASPPQINVQSLPANRPNALLVATDPAPQPSAKDSEQVAARNAPVQNAPDNEPAPQSPKTKDKPKSAPQTAVVPIAVPLPQAAPIPKAENSTVIGNITSKRAEPIVAQQAVDHAQSAVVQTLAQVKPAPQHEQTPSAPQTSQNFSAPAKFDLSSHGGGQNAQSEDHGQNNPQSLQPAPMHAAAPSATASQPHEMASNVPAVPQTAPVLAGAPLTQAAVQAHIVVQPSPQNSIAAPMSYDIGAMAITIAAKSHDGDHHFDIRLDPPELGSIAVRLTVDHTGQAAAHLTADKPETLQLLQNDSCNLQSALKDAGLNLANNGLNFSLRGDQRQAGQSFQRGNARARNLSVSAVAAPTATSAPISSYAPGALDITI